jgi:DNA-binding NarL/FixJ family response regulator
MKRVLIVDYSDLVRICIRRVFEENGFIAIEAIDLDDATSKLSIGSFDVVVLDSCFSELLLDKKLEAYVVVLTNDTSNYIVKEFTKYRINTLMKKPVELLELKKVVSDVLSI